MSIRPRLSGSRMLEYHRYFGTGERPPFGIDKLAGYGNNRETYGRSATYDEYKAALELRKTRTGEYPAAAIRELASEMGPWQWPAVTGYTGMILAPRRLALHRLIEMPDTRDDMYMYDPYRDNVIIGWWYNRRLGIGPGEGITAWVATKPGYITNGPAAPLYSNGPRIIGLNVFEDWELSGTFEEEWSDFPDIRAKHAIEEVYTDYKRIHGIKFDHKSLIPRERG